MKKVIIKSLIGIGGAIYLTACNPTMTSSEYLEKGKALLAENKNGAAIIELKNAIQQQASNVEARFMLGRAYLSQGDYINAQKELEKALELGYDAESIIPKLAEVKFKLHDYEQAIEYADTAHSLTDESYIVVLTYAGMGSLYNGKFDRAKDYFESAIQLSDSSLYGQLSQGYLARSGEELTNAIAAINLLIEKHKNFADAYLLKGYLLQANKEYLQAAEAFKAYSTQRPKELSIMFFIAQNYLRAGAFDKAEPTIDSVLAIADGNALANQMKSQILFEAKDYASALEYSVKAFQKNDRLTNAIIIAGVSAYKVGKLEQSYLYLQKVQDSLPDGHFVKALFIELQLKLGYEVEATNALSQMIDSGNVDSSIILLASNELAALGQVTQAKELLKKTDVSSDANTLAQSGILKLKLEDVVSGIDTLEKSLSIDPSSTATEIALAIGYIKNKQFDLALAIAKQLQQNDERKSDGLLLQATIESKLGDLTKATKTLNEILLLDENNTSALFQLGAIAQNAKNTEEAFSYFTKVLALQADHVRALANLTLLIESSTIQLDKAIEFYQSALTEKPNNYLKFGLAHAYSLKKDYQRALDLYLEIAKSDTSLNGIEIMIGDMYNALNNYDEAIRAYKQYYDKDKKSLIAGNKLTAIYEKTRRYKEVISHLDVMYNYHHDKLGLKLLKNYFQSVIGETVSQSDIRTINSSSLKSYWLNEQLLGNIAVTDKEYDIALHQYNNAYTKNPTNVSLKGMVKALTLSGKASEAVKLLESHILKDADNNEAKMMLANAYIATNNKTKAISRYKDLLNTDSENILALNNLSYLEMSQGDKSSALIHINRAIAIKPDSPVLLDTLGEVLTANGEYEEAIKAFSKAIQLGAGNNVAINKAKTFILASMPEQAKQLLVGLKADNEKQAEQIYQLLLPLK